MAIRILLINNGRIPQQSARDTYCGSSENVKPQSTWKRNILINMETYTLWLMPCNEELFPLGLPNFQDPDLRIRCNFMASNDDDAKSRVIVNQLSKHMLSRYPIAWKIDRGDNHEPLGPDHEVDSDVHEPFSYEETIGLMGGPEAAFERAMENRWLGLALGIAMSEPMNRNDPEWDERRRIAEEKLRQKTDALIRKGWSQGKISARLRVALRRVPHG